METGVVARQVEVWLRPEGKTEAHVPHSIFPYLCTAVPPKENEISTNNTNTRAYLQFSTPTLAFTTKVPRIQAIAHHHTHLPISQELIFWNDHYNYYTSTLLLLLLLLLGGRAIDRGSYLLVNVVCMQSTHTHTREVGEYKTYGAVKQWRQSRIKSRCCHTPHPTTRLRDGSEQYQ